MCKIGNTSVECCEGVQRIAQFTLGKGNGSRVCKNFLGISECSPIDIGIVSRLNLKRQVSEHWKRWTPQKVAHFNTKTPKRTGDFTPIFTQTPYT